ncbi:MAG: ThuA domain-containing protein [Flavobacteriales bacterium]|nr:ThuA domain-containing protein [Flavobacteriales bacterium]MBP6696763.1 ThuA domain-containing protein [Flavobacteriales bacterium]
MRLPLLLLISQFFGPALGQSVLHYAETSGFDHQTRAVSLAFLQDIGVELGFSVVDDVDGSAFNSLANLAAFDVIVFSNTSGNALLDPAQRANFEAYVAAGGSVLGIHAASDTYRHTTANGANTGTWDFYAELIGASVQENPNHVSGTPLYAMQHIGTHASTAHLPDPWLKNEEYYYWENGYYRPDNITVLEVEETIGPNNQVNSYDAPRPMSWYRELPEGGRVFYTALGHAPSNYTSDTLFHTHVRDALAWLLGTVSVVVADVPLRSLTAWPNPASEVCIVPIAVPEKGTFRLLDGTGRVIATQRCVPPSCSIEVSELLPGTYWFTHENGAVRFPIVVLR